MFSTMRWIFGWIILSWAWLGVCDTWFQEIKTGERQPVAGHNGTEFDAPVSMPGAMLVYQEPDRSAYRPAEDTAFKRFFSMEACFESSAAKPLNAKVFFKNKDGYFFQSVRDFALEPNQWRTLEVDLTGPARELEPVGHAWQWCDLAAGDIFNCGVKLYSDAAGEGRLRWRNVRFHTERARPPLRVVDWRLPENSEQNRRWTATFRLSREYFNAFDPDEIAVDYEIRRNGESQGRRFPAFYTQDYRRSILYTRESWLPFGAPYWETRYLPDGIGIHYIRLHIKDRHDSLTTPWRVFTVVPTDAPGAVRISPKNPRYLAFANGETFWPVGLNMHTNIDLRSENVFKLGHRPDRGLADYEDYFAAAAAAGINAVEIWLAAWSFSPEWTAANSGMYGMGRYNLMNMAKLDALLKLAESRGIRIHMVLDNHGRISTRSDPEWKENPMNAKGEFARANGAFLEAADQFFTDERAWRFYQRRNRYLAARYGADPAVWGVELWSELDLTENFKARYKDQSVLEWHKKAARMWKSMSGAGQLMTTHLCGDYHNNINRKELYRLPGIDYVVGDAYRDVKRHIVDFLAAGSREVRKNFPGKPYLVTEYGGTASAGARNVIQADIHGGIWSAFFLEYAGTPFLWWHDLVHVRNLYSHYGGLARFIGDIDRANPELRPTAVLVSDGAFKALALASETEFYAWVYNVKAMSRYPEQPETIRSGPGLRLKTAAPPAWRPGRWQVEFFHTVTGEKISARTVDYPGGELRLELPEFSVDLAMKMRPLPPNGK